MAKFQRPDCQISQLCWHVVPFYVNYLNLSRNVNIHWSEPCTLEFCTIGKMCPGFLRKECWSVKASRVIMGFFIYIYINYILFKKRKKKKTIKKHSWEQLLQVQPAVTKNVVSIFIEVLYRSRVENIYYLNYFTGKKGQGFVESWMWLFYTHNDVHDWNYWFSVACLQPNNC